MSINPETMILDSKRISQTMNQFVDYTVRNWRYLIEQSYFIDKDNKVYVGALLSKRDDINEIQKEYHFLNFVQLENGVKVIGLIIEAKG